MRQLPFEALKAEANAKYDVLKVVPPQYLNDTGNTALEAWRHIVNAMYFSSNTEELIESVEAHVTMTSDPAVAKKLRAYIDKIKQ